MDPEMASLLERESVQTSTALGQFLTMCFAWGTSHACVTVAVAYARQEPFDSRDSVELFTVVAHPADII